MLKDVLSPGDCAKCGFCCSFRRQSLHLTPLFSRETVDEIRRLHPEARFKTLPNGAVTMFKATASSVVKEAMDYAKDHPEIVIEY